jgi:hypothetical protein
MAETPYLVDSNVLLRWVKPDHSDYPAIVSPSTFSYSMTVCSATPRRMLESFGMPVPALLIAMAMVYRLEMQTTPLDSSNKGFDPSRTASPFTRSGGECW